MTFFMERPQIRPGNTSPSREISFERAIAGRKTSGVTIVILQELQRLAEARARREYGADPVMNETVRHVDLLSGLPGRQTLDVDLAAVQCIELRTAFGVRKGRRFGEMASGPSAPRSRGREPVERRDGARLQIGGGRGWGEAPEHDDGGEKSGRRHGPPSP